jgi:hypothetical protein
MATETKATETEGLPHGMRTYPVVESVIDMFAEWLHHRREIDELCACGAAEHARIAHDLGVSDDTLDDLVRRGPHAADELPKMMKALGLDPAAVARAQPLIMRDLERVCSQCPHKRVCKDDLAHGTAAQEYEVYCGNAETLDALRGGSAR